MICVYVNLFLITCNGPQHPRVKPIVYNDTQLVRNAHASALVAVHLYTFLQMPRTDCEKY